METNLEKEQPMYMGKDRIKLEAIIKKIKTTAENNKLKNTKLMVYKLTLEGIDYVAQSPFYNLLSGK